MHLCEANRRSGCVEQAVFSAVIASEWLELSHRFIIFGGEVWNEHFKGPQRGFGEMSSRSCLQNRCKKHTLCSTGMKLLERPQAIEQIIGKLKADLRLSRCHLQGGIGDWIHGMTYAGDFCTEWLLRITAEKGLRAFFKAASHHVMD